MLNRKRSFSSSHINMEEFPSLGSQHRDPLHRRSASDSIVLLEKPYFTELSPGSSFIAGGEFVEEPSDDDIVTMFQAIDTNKIHENSSSTTDKNASSGDEAHLIPDSFIEIGPQNATENEWDRCFNPNMDPKKIKRMLANRESAQRSRLRKLEYVNKLKRDIDTEEAKVSLLSPQVSYYELQRMILKNQNDEMKEKIEILEKEKAYKEAEFQALKEELDKLNLAYVLQEGK